MSKKINKIYYIYKIHFLCGFPAGRYYLGKHVHRARSLKNDHYTGSGDFCFRYFAKYGAEEGITYIKEILEINPDAKTNADREKVIIGDLWKTDPLCMNLRPGGEGGAIPGKSIPRPQYRKKVNQYTKDGVFVKTWDSLIDAERNFAKRNSPFDSGSTIRAAIRGLNSYGFGFQWRYYEGNTNNIPPGPGRKKQECLHVYQYDLDGNFIKEWDSAREAAIGIGKPKMRRNIQAICKKGKGSAAGYQWAYSPKEKESKD